MRTVPVDATGPAATRLLAESGVRRLVVTEHGRLIGVLSRGWTGWAHAFDDRS